MAAETQSDLVFDIDRKKVVEWVVIDLLLVGLLAVVVGAVVVLLLLWLGLKRIITDWASSLDYRLDDDVLRIRAHVRVGRFVLWRTDKAIPADRITDLKLVQGPILGYLGLWDMQVQTAGSAMAEGTLHGLREPESVREQILARVRELRQARSSAAAV